MKFSCVPEVGDFSPGGRNLGNVQLGRDDGFARTACGGQNPTPGVDDHRVPECIAAVFMQTRLRGGNHEGAVLDGACPEQHFPMRFARLAGEGGRQRQDP